MRGLLHREAVDLPDEPFPRGLRGRERGERTLQRPTPPVSEPVPRGDEVRGLVIVEPDAGAEERRNRGHVPAKEEALLRQSAHRRIGRPGLRLDREDAVRDLLVQSLVRLPPFCLELFEPSTYRVSFFLVLSPEGIEVAICGSTARATSRAPSVTVRTRSRRHRTSEENPRHKTTSRKDRRTFKYRACFAATMALMHSLLSLLDRVSPAKIAYAHCDIPCGIYDPHHAQMAAHTVIRMVDLIGQLEKPGPNATADQRQEYMNKLARYIATKEQHAEIFKTEVRVLWGDYFKPEHVQQFPNLHDLVWKSLKSASKGRQEINLQAAEDMLRQANEIATIFWKTKNVSTYSAKSPYVTGRETVYPKIG